MILVSQRTALFLTYLICFSLLPSPVMFAQESPMNDAKAHFKKGFVEFQMGNLDEALTLFQKALELAPSYKDALFFVAVTSQRLGNYKDEVSYYDRFLELDPQSAVAWSNRGVALQRLERYWEVEPSFQKALNVDPNNPMIYRNRGTCRLNMGQYADAHKDFLKAKELGIAPEHLKYLTWTTRLLRQIKGEKLPPQHWKPKLDAYHTDLKRTRPGHCLIDMPDKDDKPISQGGLTSLVGYVGTRISFDGSSKESHEYAPGFYVWQGGVINDPEYGVLLENGTQFRYESWKGRKKLTKLGKISGWKCQYSSERVTSPQVTDWWSKQVPSSGWVPADEDPNFDKYMSISAPIRKAKDGKFVIDEVVAKGWDKTLKTFYMTLLVKPDTPIRVGLLDIPATLPAKVADSPHVKTSPVHSDCKVLDTVGDKALELSGKVGLAVSGMDGRLGYIVGLPGSRLDITAFKDKPLSLAGRKWRATSAKQAYLLITKEEILLVNVEEVKALQ